MHIFENSRILAYFLFVLVFFIHFVAGAVEATALTAADFPFQPGERMVYKLRWGAIPAGYAELQVLPFEKIDGKSSWHFILTVRTSEFVDMFYLVRDQVESFTDLTLDNSLLYRKKQREGKTRRDAVVTFNLANGTAIYSNMGDPEKEIMIEDGTIDPLASIYYVRTQALTRNMQIFKNVSDGKKNVRGLVKVVGRETLFIEGVKYDTFRVEPDLKGVRGVFEKSKKSKLTLWFTADERRLLVKVKSKVAVGSFTGTLMEVSRSP